MASSAVGGVSSADKWMQSKGIRAYEFLEVRWPPLLLHCFLLRRIFSYRSHAPPLILVMIGKTVLCRPADSAA